MVNNVVDNLMPPAFADEPIWKKLSEALSEFHTTNVTDLLKIMRSLRDTDTFSDPTNPQKPYYVEEFLVQSDTDPLVYRSKKIHFNRTDFTLFLESSFLNPSLNLPTVSLFTNYTITAKQEIKLNAPLGLGQKIRAVEYGNNIHDVNDVFQYSIDTKQAEYHVPLQANITLNVNTALDYLQDPPVAAKLSTGFPYNLLVVYYWNSNISDWVYVPYGNIKIIDDYVINVANVVPTDKLRIFVRRPSQELNNKLRQLGFQYPDLEFVTRPTYVDNAHILQLMADTYGKYLKESSGTFSFMDYFQYCANTKIKIERLWAQDILGSENEYGDFLEETTILGAPDTYKPIWVVPPETGGWYPTSHVNIIYDLGLFGDSIDFQAVTKFFNYVSPFNLVLHKVVLELNPPIPVESRSTWFDGAGSILQIY